MNEELKAKALKAMQTHGGKLKAREMFEIYKECGTADKAELLEILINLYYVGVYDGMKAVN